MSRRKVLPGQMNLFGEDEPLPPFERSVVSAAVQASVWRGFGLANAAIPGAHCYDAIMAALEKLQLLAPLEESERELLGAMPGWAALAEWCVRGKPSYLHTSERMRHSARLQSAGVTLTPDATLTAYFTPRTVIDAMWRAVQRFGFRGGNVLEPAAGTGRFVGYCPPAIRSGSRFVAVEIDPTTARIAEACYGQDGVRVIRAGFQDCVLPSTFDLAIGNVPFGSYTLYDRERGGGRALVHDLIIIKALRKLRPGGVGVFITSCGTMDKDNGDARRRMAALADLCGAVRLPGGVFAAEGADVATDILVFRRRAPGEAEATPSAGRWIDATFECQGVKINHYWGANPTHVLGSLSTRNGRYGEPELVVTGEAPDAAALDAVFDTFAVPYRAADSAGNAPTELPVTAAQGMIEGSFQIVNGELTRVEDGLLSKLPPLHGKRDARIRSMLAVRDALGEVLRLQGEESEAADVEAARAVLNNTYDQHRAAFGAISQRENQLALQEDPSFPLLLSLESWDENTESFAKAPVFAVRTTWPSPPPVRPTTLSDAITCCLAGCGKLSAGWIATALGRDEQTVVQELLTLDTVFRDPVSQAVMHADEYLSGNVRAKLLEARSALEHDSQFARNVRALEGVIPPDVAVEDIVVRLGQPWLTTDLVVEWAKDVHGASVRIKHLQATANWSVDGYGGQGTASVSFVNLLADALNQVPTKVYERSSDGKSYLDAEATLAAQARAAELHQSFAEWVTADPIRGATVQTLYNERVNCMVRRHYDGSHLGFPGMSALYTPRETQRNAVWRGLTLDPVLFDHFVGAGKTLTLCALAMELRRTGLAKKPLIVVANKTLPAFTAEFLRLYPAAKVLMMGRDDMEKTARRRFVAKVATGDWDAVVMAQSVFDRISVRPESVKAYAEHLAADVQAAASECEASDRRRLQQNAISVRERIESLFAAASKDDHIRIEDLGVDYLAVDEAHAYKNLYVPSRMTGVAGVATTASQRALSMLLKVRHIYERRGAIKGVAFATATPITNTLTEVFVMQKYLRPDALEEIGVAQFDAWAAAFGTVVNEVEVAPDGSGFRVKDRFARFQNVPELSRICAQFWDTVFPEDIPGLQRPALATGKPIVLDVPASHLQESYVRGLVARADDVRQRKVKPNEDNLLKIVMDGMKCAMDLRLLDPSLPDEETSKLNACVRNVYELWARGTERRTTQIIFSDIGVHEQHGFSVYRDICAKLMGRGVPEREIAIAQDFNTDAKVAQLDRKINAGEVRIVLGSTAVLGIGRNVQRRLCALHHLDAPYRADEVEQRDGRAIRQGNTCSEVAIYRYVTAGTFDAFKWQTVERKARFVGQFRRHNGTERVIEDIDAGLLSFAEVKALASGNPLARDAVLLQSQERRLAASARDATARLRQLRWKHESMSGVLERAIASLADVERVTSRLVPLDADGFGCSAADGRALSLPDFLAAACHQAAVCRLGGEINAPLVGTYGGAAVRVAQNGYGFNMSLLGLADAYVVEPIRISAYAPDSIAKALARAYKGLAETPQQVANKVAELRESVGRLAVELEKLPAEVAEATAQWKAVTARLAEVEAAMSTVAVAA